MSNEPTENGANGRGPGGRFAKGNPGGPGSGVARKTARFRTKLFAAVKVGDFAEIVTVLVQEAKAGQSWAVKLALEYLVGPPDTIDLAARIETLEAALLGRKQ